MRRKAMLMFTVHVVREEEEAEGGGVINMDDIAEEGEGGRRSRQEGSATPSACLAWCRAMGH